MQIWLNCYEGRKTVCVVCEMCVVYLVCIVRDVHRVYFGVSFSVCSYHVGSEYNVCSVSFGMVPLVCVLV